MVITWYGHACFKIQSGEMVIAVDPYEKEIGLTPPRFRADVVLVSHGHHDHNNAEAIAGEPFVITGPGEYEVKGVTITGIETFHDAVSGRERGMNTMYKIVVEDITLLHMGDFGEHELREATLESVGDVDVVMIPVGGTYTIDGERAEKIVRSLEPAYVIPMHYKIPGLKVDCADSSQFLKEMGVRAIEPQEKLSIKKKDFSEDEKTSVIVLNVA